MALQQNSIPSNNDNLCILWMKKPKLTQKSFDLGSILLFVNFLTLINCMLKVWLLKHENFLTINNHHLHQYHYPHEDDDDDDDDDDDVHLHVNSVACK